MDRGSRANNPPPATSYSFFKSVYWPGSPLRSIGTPIRGASVFEFSVCSLFTCLLVCLFVLGKFSNYFVQYKAAGVRKNVVRMNIFEFSECSLSVCLFSNFFVQYKAVKF